MVTHNGNTHHTQSCSHPPWRDTYFYPYYFFTLSVFPFSHCFFLSGSLTFSPFQAMYLVTGLFSKPFIVICHLVFPLVCCAETFARRLHFDPTSLPIFLAKSFSVFLLYFSLSPVFSHNMSTLLLSSVSNGHWVLRPVRDIGTQGDKGPLTFSRWLGLCLIWLCHPRWQNTKAQR